MLRPAFIVPNRRNVTMRYRLLLLLFLPLTALGQNNDHDIAFEWIEAQLKGIRVDFARPPIHARNLHHVSLAMYDAWAVYDDVAETDAFGQNPAWLYRRFRRYFRVHPAILGHPLCPKRSDFLCRLQGVNPPI